MPDAQSPKLIRIAISRCLLGDEVRYDARGQRDDFIADTLGPHFEWVPICPEVEIGLGVPRAKIQLERPSDGQDADGVEWRLVMPATGRDLTAEMRGYARRCVGRLKKQGISGCLLKSRSPSCGPSRVKTFAAGEPMRRVGVGIFAKTLMEMWPELPVEEDERMHDPAVCKNWLERIHRHSLSVCSILGQ